VGLAGRVPVDLNREKENHLLNAIPSHFSSLDSILHKVLHEEPLARQEVLHLLAPKTQEEQEGIYEVARKLRDRYFGNKVFLYGFVYFSTWCRNHCIFCFYRAPNVLCERYRKTDEEILDAVTRLAESGVHLLDMTMGEDPACYNREDDFKPLLNLIKKAKKETGLPIMVSWGVVPDSVLERLPAAGADWFACYQETHNPELFRTLRLDQDYQRRLDIKTRAKKLGMLIEEGILSGVGESLEDVVDSIEEMKAMEAHQVRVMNFIPQKGTPLADYPSPHPEQESRMIAILRLLLPHRLIPASLDVYGIDGLRDKLRAGANVVTSLILPSSELRGVAQSTLGICEGLRSAKAVTPVLTELGLRRATLEEYISWVEHEKGQLTKDSSKRERSSQTIAAR
jgi:methylornithine synthase